MFTRAELARFLDILLDESRPMGGLLQEVHAYYSRLTTCFELDQPRAAAIQDIILPGGKAISPYNAAYCLLEFQRTAQFVRGLNAAIASHLAAGVMPVHVLYAGTGPFAGLLLPVLGKYTPDQLQATLVEIQPYSLGILRRLFTHDEFKPYIYNIIEQDAATIQLANWLPVDIFLAETMNFALQKEPQVNIACHIGAQLSSKAIMIPEEVHVFAGAYRPGREMERMLREDAVWQDFVQIIGSIFRLNKNTRPPFNPVNIAIPESLATPEYCLALFTEISIYNQFALKPWECSLTQLLPFWNYRTDGLGKRNFALQYQISEHPGFSVS